MAIDFADLASRYIDRRIDQATQPFTDPEAYLNRRLGFGDEGANVTPRSTTISYNEDGSQTITNKMEMGPPQQNAPQPSEPFPGAAQYALPGPAMAAPQPMAQPMAPVGPMGPAVDPAEEERRRQQEMMQRQAAQAQAQPQPMAQPQPAASAAPVAPEAVSQPAPAQQPPQLPPMPQPGAPVQLAGPMVAGAVPQSQPQPPAAAPAPAPAPQAAAPAPAPTQPAPGSIPMAGTWLDQVSDISGDPTKLAAYMGNTTNSEESRKFAGKLLKEHLDKTSKEADAEKKVMKAVEDGNMLPLMKEIKSKSEEGSYVKAYLYARLGLNDLARDEQKKLGAGATYQAVMGPDGSRALIQYNADGLPMKGFDESGKKLSDERLAAFAAQASPTKGAAVHTTAFQVMEGPNKNELFWQRTMPNGTTQLVNDKGQVYTGSTANLRPFGIGSDIRTKNEIQLQGLRNEFIAKPSQAGATELMKLAAAADPGDGSEIRKAQALIDRLPFPGKEAGAPAAPAAPAAGPVAPGAMPPAGPAAARPQAVGAAPAPQGGAITGISGGAPAGGVSTSGRRPGESFDAYQKRLAIEKSAAETSIGVAGKRSESFNKILDEEVRPQAQAGDEISQLRKQQFKIFDRPGVDSSKIFGIANGAGQSPGDQRWTMLRDVLAGKVSEPEDKIRERAAALGLNRDEQSALAEYNNLNASINARTLKTTAGAGSVSDAEQRANRERNVDPTQMPALGAYNSMAQSQFNGDLARYKGDWAQTSKATNALQLDKEWRKEQQRLVNTYADIAKQRIDYIVQNGSTAAAVKEGYRRFPVPEYDPQTETWKKTRPLGSYER